MASDKDLEVVVSVEASVHKGLGAGIQAISDEYGLQVTCVLVEWMDVSTIEKGAHKIAKLTIETFSK